ncbi:HAD-IC family P-type ATPase [Lactobacillus mulieris]|jgi:HAD ATPase, P-type, family IC|uniref:HAD-IC family P-type ATPase n=1 Tax=Lactobacillus mulieris TaxID=2508708 RepID=A0AAP3GWE3_9LACO|nr:MULTISPECIES: HAD-IC family P-type ATPase [Lactobacillus]EEU21494.1 HAD ATPase, P-type, family IC [Lactobacillus jensenii 27-2-CHN]EEX24365.1 E1-E2 ATPase [Lactobacillus jensenii 115-3-CHN]EFH29535.1 E1-E2 ATPase [Lactobacillus jensenii JV-V16]KAA9243434.1 HAD-IC family P-type ATPase [Lactobacillus jensenii]KAA9372139.1 HAD-IC family P-type ATPase [Lactobacillus jensenii]
METQLHGLTSAEAEKRLKKDGPNEVPEPEFNFWKAFLSKLWNLSAWILEAALLLELVLGKGIQAGFVLLMLLFAAYNGATQKKKSRRVLNDISHELTPTVAVERDGKWIKLNSKQLVVGDLINLKRGDVLAADVSLKDGKITCDESSITGESAPVNKQLNDTAYAGTTVVDGSGLAIVTATGANSRSGKTINLINQSAAPGHLQQLLTKIIFYLCMLSLTLTIIIIIAAFMRGEGIHGVIQMLPFLAMMFIASIPVAMPSTFAISNSFEAKRLSKEGVLTSDLTGIQDAANLNLILLDKTGTITENKTAVSSLTNLSSLSDSEVLQFAEAATDKRNTSIIDAAIIEYSEQKGLTSLTPEKFVPFTSDTGYSEAVVNGQNLKLGSFKQLSLIDTNANEKIKDIDFTAGRSVALLIDNKLAAVFILQDKVRSDSKAALAELKKRGIRPIMLTGDNQRTAAAVAKQVSLTGNVISIHDFNEQTDLDSLAGIADVLPEDKLKMVKFFQEKGFIVGMTGDGVNDAPALKQAEVGIAVANAADVAKRSGKMVLLDDGLMPIVKILDAGHRVYQRMTTWSLTKLSRTAELTMILTFGYLLFGYLPMALNAMVIYTIMNNMVTMMIGTDNTHITYKPENWNIDRMAKVSMSLASGWTLIGCLFVWFMNNKLGFTQGQVGTMVYVYCVLSAMLIVLITRTKTYFWQSHPSRLVGTVQIIDVALTFALALLGIAMTQISIINLGLVIIVSLISAIIIDLIYQPIMKNR